MYVCISNQTFRLFTSSITYNNICRVNFISLSSKIQAFSWYIGSSNTLLKQCAQTRYDYSDVALETKDEMRQPIIDNGGLHRHSPRHAICSKHGTHYLYVTQFMYIYMCVCNKSNKQPWAYIKYELFVASTINPFWTRFQIIYWF